jgi:hypothetical protein
MADAEKFDRSRTNERTFHDRKKLAGALTAAALLLLI